ncbi:hypothetical protein [Pseudocolwellia agarivorans]|uniref:hypothetical protein n=1 Tax=Pseudocolwellia agarivorans TaxID=1911682 RepID=UPI0009851D21|nr:hypothetical protein [Pseudocolwellia agarivorans]
MKHSKTTQKLQNKLDTTIEKLTTLLQEELTGFTHVSFTVKFDNFPNSLLVHCTFDNDVNLSAAKTIESTYQKKLHQLLFKQGILLKNSSHNLAFIQTK